MPLMSKTISASTAPTTAPATGNVAKRQRALAAIAAHPDLADREVARLAQVSHTYVAKLRRVGTVAKPVHARRHQRGEHVAQVADLETLPPQMEARDVMNAEAANAEALAWVNRWRRLPADRKLLVLAYTGILRACDLGDDVAEIVRDLRRLNLHCHAGACRLLRVANGLPDSDDKQVFATIGRFIEWREATEYEHVAPGTKHNGNDASKPTWQRGRRGVA